MIKRIIRFSAENRFIVIAATIVGLVFAWWSMRTIPMDALPDLSDTQVIIFSKWDRSPDIIEDQVTYPITTALLGAPKVKAIRGFSDFGFSYVYVIFEDGTDVYWARTRVLEYLSKINAQLPAGVKTELGPDASGVGWVFQYALVDKTGKTRHRRTALVPRLVSEVRHSECPWRIRGCDRRRPCQAISGHSKPQRAGGVQNAARHRHRGRPQR